MVSITVAAVCRASCSFAFRTFEAVSSECHSVLSARACSGRPFGCVNTSP